jgi:hypothetical protein
MLGSEPPNGRGLSGVPEPWEEQRPADVSNVLAGRATYRFDNIRAGWIRLNPRPPPASKLDKSTAPPSGLGLSKSRFSPQEVQEGSVRSYGRLRCHKHFSPFAVLDHACQLVQRLRVGHVPEGRNA